MPTCTGPPQLSEGTPSSDASTGWLIHDPGPSPPGCLSEPPISIGWALLPPRYRWEGRGLEVLGWERNDSGVRVGSGSQCLNSEKGGWLCRNRESPTSSRLVTWDPQITHLVFFLHGEQGTLGDRPQAGLRPVGSAPRVSPPLAGKFLRHHTASPQHFRTEFPPPSNPETLSNSRPQTAAIRRPGCRCGRPGTQRAQKTPSTGFEGGARVTSRPPANEAAWPQGSIAQQRGPRT